MKQIFWIISIALGVLCAVKIFVLGYSDEDTDTTIINLITECISVFITVVIINKIIEKDKAERKAREEAVKKAEYNKTISEVLGNSLTELFGEIFSVYTAFILKEPVSFSGDFSLQNQKEEIERIMENIDDYVNTEFRSKPIKFYLINIKKLTFPNKEQIIEYQEFCERLFKPKILNLIGNFINRYISILPEDLRLSIYTIENSVKSTIFWTPLQFGLSSPINTTQNDIDELKKQLIIIGIALIDIYNIISSADKDIS